MMAFRVVFIITLLVHALGSAGLEFVRRPFPVYANSLAAVDGNSELDCAVRCQSEGNCRYFKWDATSEQCSMYSTMVGPQPMVDLYERMDAVVSNSGCPQLMIPDDQGVCHCYNGRYGNQCDQAFNHQLSVAQEFDLDAGWGAAQIEINNVSYVIWASDTDNSSCQNSLKVYAYNATSTQYDLKQVISIDNHPSEVRAFTLNNDNFLLISSDRFLSNDATAWQTLYQFDKNLTLFEPAQYYVLGSIYSSNTYRKSNGDIYVCSLPAANVRVNDSIPGVVQVKGTNADITLISVMPAWNQSSSCTFFEIGGDLYSVADSNGDQPIVYYSVGTAVTPQPSLPSSERTSGITFVFSPLMNTNLLAVGKMTQGIKIYKWTGGSGFTGCADVNTTSKVDHLHLVAAGSDIFLLANTNNGSETNTFFTVFRYNSVDCTFSLFQTVPAAGPYGGFHSFWYLNRLYLMVINHYNSSLTSGNPLKHHVKQQIFAWK